MKFVIAAAVLLLGSSFSMAQESKPSEAEKQKAKTGFEWLKQIQGNWKTPFNGSMSSRIVGNRWLVNEISFQKGVYSIQTLGYDSKKKKFVGTWVDASSNFIWQYSGSLDKSGKILVLQAKGPDMKDSSKMRQYQDTYEFKSKDEIAVVSKVLNDDKQWKTFNKSKMTRNKKN